MLRRRPRLFDTYRFEQEPGAVPRGIDRGVATT